MILFFLLPISLLIVYTINRNDELTNFLNKKIIFNVCGWNISHIFSHYFISLFLKCDNKNKFKQILMFDISWFLLEYICFIIIHKDKKIVKKQKNGVYENVYKPRLDDFIFNFLGIYLYTKIHNKRIF